MKAVILCAGDGERMKPLTDTIPKPLLLIKEKPILYYIIESLPEAVDEVFLVIQDKHRVFFEEFLKNNKFNIKTNILVQDLKEKGTYFALVKAKEYLEKDNKFLVLNGDDIFLKEDLEKLINQEAPCYGLSKRVVSKEYRTCDLDFENKKITSFRTQKEEEFGQEVYCFSGSLTLNKDFFNYSPVYFGSKNEAGVPHTLFANSNSVGFFILNKWIQINNIEDLEKANKESIF